MSGGTISPCQSAHGALRKRGRVVLQAICFEAYVWRICMAARLDAWQIKAMQDSESIEPHVSTTNIECSWVAKQWWDHGITGLTFCTSLVLYMYVGVSY